MIKTIYVCDNCKKESENQNFLVGMSVKLNYFRAGYSTNLETLKINYCRDCLHDFGVSIPDESTESERVRQFHQMDMQAPTTTEKLISALSEFINEHVGTL